MPNRVILDDADKDLAMKEGRPAARGDEFILEDGEPFARNPVHPTDSYGTHHFELVTHGYSEDQILTPTSMVRPFDCADYNSGAGVGPHHEGKNPHTEPGHKSSFYSSDCGKVGDGRNPGGGLESPHSEVHDNTYEGQFFNAKNDGF